MDRSFRLARVLVAAGSPEEKAKSFSKRYQLDPKVVGEIMSVDPTLGKDLTEWVIQQIKRRVIIWPEDSTRIQQVLTRYLKFKNKPSVAKLRGINPNIFFYNFSALDEALDKAEDIGVTEVVTLPREMPEDTKVLYNRIPYLVVEVRNPESVCVLGTGSKWCTTSRTLKKEPDTAKTYMKVTEENPKGTVPFYIVWKNGKLHCQYNTEDYQFKDTRDREWDSVDSEEALRLKLLFYKIGIPIKATWKWDLLAKGYVAADPSILKIDPNEFKDGGTKLIDKALVVARRLGKEGSIAEIEQSLVSLMESTQTSSGSEKLTLDLWTHYVNTQLGGNPSEYLSKSVKTFADSSNGDDYSKRFFYWLFLPGYVTEILKQPDALLEREILSSYSINAIIAYALKFKTSRWVEAELLIKELASPVEKQNYAEKFGIKPKAKQSKKTN